MIRPLTFKRRRVLPVHRLPYVGDSYFVGASGRIGYWDVPLTGDYCGGWKTGGALAMIALKHISIYNQRLDGDHLKYIAASWIERASKASPAELETLRAQVLGFMQEIGKFAEAAAVGSRRRLAQVDEKAELKMANEGLGFKAPERKRPSPISDDTSSSIADSIKA